MFTYIHVQVEKDNSLHNWHCKYEPVKFQTSYKKINKHRMKPIDSLEIHSEHVYIYTYIYPWIYQVVNHGPAQCWYRSSLSLSLSLSYHVVLWP
jgi:hypothetical protein